MKILLVEDDVKVAEFIKKGLIEQSFEVEVAYDGAMGKRLALQQQYDVIISDVNMPQINGFDLVKIIRNEGVTTPILLLTAFGTTDDKITGFEAGADDYLVKPFEFRELLVRLKSLHKRSGDQSQSAKILKINDLELDLDKKTVVRAGQKIELTAKEFSLLEYFLRNKGKVISRVDIAEKVWDLKFDTGTNVIDVYINFLRKKIDKDFDKKLIHTMVGMGYVMREV
jgi:DNA-binding response OmpR family regulator